MIYIKNYQRILRYRILGRLTPKDYCFLMCYLWGIAWLSLAVFNLPIHAGAMTMNAIVIEKPCSNRAEIWYRLASVDC